MEGADRDPWLEIPLDDYEVHMSAPQVAQLAVLSDLFAQMLAAERPDSVGILGIAGGNGLEHVDPDVTHRVVGIDVNPTYLEVVRRRYGARLNLDLYCVDLAQEACVARPVRLAHAALIFEHAGTGRCLENALSLVEHGGVLSVVLQLPAESAPDIAPTSIASIQSLAASFSLIDPDTLRLRIESSRFRLVRQTRRPLAGGKAFWMGVFHHT